jgi:hypothetical protein
MMIRLTLGHLPQQGRRIVHATLKGRRVVFELHVEYVSLEVADLAYLKVKSTSKSRQRAPYGRSLSCPLDP